MAYFKVTGTILDHDGLMDQIIAELTSNPGLVNPWVRTQLDATPAGTVLGDNRTGREELLRAPGLGAGVGDPTDFWIQLGMIDQVSYAPTLMWNGFHSMLQGGALPALGTPIPVSAASRSGTTVSLTVTGHGLPINANVLGLASYKGSDDIAAFNTCENLGNIPTTHLINVADANTLEYTDSVSGTDSATGGVVVVRQNPFGARTGASAGDKASLPASMTDAAFDLIGFVNERFFGAVAIQGANHMLIAFGAVNRDRHVQADEAFIAKLANTETGTAGVVTLDLDRSVSAAYAGQKCWIVPVDSAEPLSNGIANGWHSDAERFDLTGVAGLPTAVEGVITNGAVYSAGSLIGHDPVPACVIGTDNDVASSIALDNAGYSARFAWEIDGTRTGQTAQAYAMKVFGTAQEAEMDPDDNTRFTIEDIFLTATAAKGIRGPLPGVHAVSDDATWTDQDLFRTGNNTPPSSGDYIGIRPQAANVTYKVAYGPDAT